MPTFRAKPVTVTAHRFEVDRLPWPDGVEAADRGYHLMQVVGPAGSSDLDGAARWNRHPYIVYPGDWIVTSATGVRHPCNAKAFSLLYDAADGIEGALATGKTLNDLALLLNECRQNGDHVTTTAHKVLEHLGLVRG